MCIIYKAAVPFCRPLSHFCLNWFVEINLIMKQEFIKDRLIQTIEIEKILLHPSLSFERVAS